MSRQLKILLINICLRPKAPKRSFPIGLAYIASAIERTGLKFKIIDLEVNRYGKEELETLLKNTEFDVVACGTIVTGYKIIKELCALIRKINKDAVIIVGNSVASSIPEILMARTEADIAVIGEGDVTIVEVLQALEGGTPLEQVKGIYFQSQGRISSTPVRPAISDIDAIPIPHWELFDMETYIKSAIYDIPEPYPIPKKEINAFVVNTARGCVFRCSFCYHAFRQDRYRYRSPASILAEIRMLQGKWGINYVNFYDELTFFSKDQAKNFVDATLASGLKFFWNIDARSDLFTTKDIDFLKRMKLAGCEAVGYSLESADPGILKKMNKNLRVEDFIEQKKALDQAGIRTFTSIVLGYPEETIETIRKTFAVCYELNIYPSAGYLLPQPGTVVYEEAKKKGFIKDEEEYLLKLGDRQDLRLNLTAIPDEAFETEVHNQLARIANKLKLNLSQNELIKTGTFIVSREEKEI